MNLNIYLDEKTCSRLDAAAEKLGEDRDTLIRKVIDDWLARHDKTRWPDAVLEFQGMPDFAPFESHRAGLIPPSADPLAWRRICVPTFKRKDSQLVPTMFSLRVPRWREV